MTAVVFLRGILYSMLRLMCVIMVSCVGTVFFIWCVMGTEFDEAHGAVSDRGVNGSVLAGPFGSGIIPSVWYRPSGCGPNYPRSPVGPAGACK